MVTESLVTALLIAAGCNLFLFAAWWVERRKAARYLDERNRAVRIGREALAALKAATGTQEGHRANH